MEEQNQKDQSEATAISQKVKDKTCKIGVKNKKIRGTLQITKRPKKRGIRKRKSSNT